MEILKAFWKLPYLNVTYCIDLKIGTIILGKEIYSQEVKLPYCRLDNTKHTVSSARLPYTVQKPVRAGFVITGTLSI